MLTEPIVAGRLYGGMMERVADEVKKLIGKVENGNTLMMMIVDIN